MNREIIYLLLFTLLLSSCATYKKFDYASIESYTSLEGIYCDTSGLIPLISKFEFENHKRLNHFVLRNSGWELEDSYKGKYNKKTHTFDIWKSRKIYPFILVMGYNFEKMRVGKDREGNLIINEAHDHTGIVIPLGAAGDAYSVIKKLSPLIEYPPFPIQIEGKWGYRDFETDSLPIEARYDSVCSFEREVARVQINDKWGVIDKKGKILVPLCYDEITPFDIEISYVNLDGYWGIINRDGTELVSCKHFKIDPFRYNRNYTYVYAGTEGQVGLLLRDGQEVLPTEYDRIENTDYSSNQLNKVIIHKDGLKGIADISGIIYPPIFENIKLVSDEKYIDIVAYTVLNRKMYYLDDKGYMYPEAKLSLGDIFSSGLIRVKPDCDKKIHYTEFLNKNN